MNILIVVDKYGSAIHRLADSVEKHNPHFNIKTIAIHPKRNSADDLFQAQKYMQWADLVDIHYWKSGEVLKTTFPVEFEAKKKIICHFNPYDLDKQDWKKTYDDIVVGNQYQAIKIPYAKLIPYGIDLDAFEFNDVMPDDPTPIVNMVVGRIEGKKGVLEVAKAVAELGYKMLLVGRVSNAEYMQEVLNTKAVTFIENASEQELRDAYYKSTIHVCNSIDDFESGTLPMLEAMACGTPVLTRNIGHVPDLNNGKNMEVRSGKVDDIEDLKIRIKSLCENKEYRKKLRENAFNTVKNRYDKKMARQFSTLYYRVLESAKPLVSVIIPTRDRGDALIECVVSAVSQDYSNYEVIIVDSGEYSVEPYVRKLKNEYKVPVKYIHFQEKGYTLAEARNRGIIEAEGEILVFCDDRLAMDKDAVKAFAVHSNKDNWLWGVKDQNQKAFVENFSSIRREDFIKAGMFNERVDKWGGMSEEIRTRFTRLGYAFNLIKQAQAKSNTRSGDRSKKRKDLIGSKFLLYKMYG